MLSPIGIENVLPLYELDSRVCENMLNKIRDLFKVKLYTIRSESKKKRERKMSERERERL